jgi:membrane protease YdiL (CAAX protease family)
MNSFFTTIKQHIRLMQLYPITAIFVLTIVVLILITNNLSKNNSGNSLIHATGYLLAIWMAAFAVDLTINIQSHIPVGFPIRFSIENELLIIIISTYLGAVFLAVRYFTNWETLKGIIKILILPLVLCTFPVVLSLVFLLKFKYSVNELGINLNYWYVPVIVHFIFGIVTMSVARESSHWKEALTNMGILNLLFTGLITAGLSEEFTRMLVQTRVAFYFNNSICIGLITSTLLWSLIHIPVFGQDYRKEGWTPALIDALRIMPLGLLWGYITYRTGSIIPSVIIHGLNFWGLQNF